MSKTNTFRDKVDDWLDKWAPVLGIVGVLITILLTLVGTRRGWLNETNATILQAGVLVALAIITAVYAFHTYYLGKQSRGQAQAAREQAEASRQQAEATRELAIQSKKQLVQMVRPIIRFAADSFSQLHGKNFVMRNIGLGPAMNVKCWFKYAQQGGSTARKNNDGRQRQFRTQVLEVNDQAGEGDGKTTWQMEIVPTPSDNVPCSFVAVYQDVYGYYFVSKALYQPTDFQNTRPLMVVEFSIEELDETTAKQRLRSAGYQE